eukprot:1623783-Lingulodinium_polyedra.AAC.1
MAGLPGPDRGPVLHLAAAPPPGGAAALRPSGTPGMPRGSRPPRGRRPVQAATGALLALALGDLGHDHHHELDLPGDHVLDHAVGLRGRCHH